MVMSMKERFYKYVQPLPFSGCWIWMGSIHPEGYGRFRVGNMTVGAHRISYRLHHGEIGDKSVCHICDVPSCVNPDHLFLGTNLDNIKDKQEKGRAAKKLTKQSVFAMRDELKNGATLNAMAEKYNVSRAMVVRIKHNKNWIGE